MLSRPKTDDSRCIRVDLSNPSATSTNECISNDINDIVCFQLKYQSVDIILETIKQHNSDILLSILLGLEWDGATYLDRSILTALKREVCFVKRLWTSYTRSKGIQSYNYIDDIICVYQMSNTRAEFNMLCSRFEFLGLLCPTCSSICR